MDPNMQIRKLEPAEMFKLASILSFSDVWKKLVAIIPKEGTEDVPQFNGEHVALLEQEAREEHGNAAYIFLIEWSTMGLRQRPTLRSTLNLLVKAELFRAADYIATELLNEEPPERPKTGPAARVDIYELLRQAQPKNFKTDSMECDSDVLLESHLNKMTYPSDLSGNVSPCSPRSDVDTDMKSGANSRNEVQTSDLIKFSASSLNAGETVNTDNNSIRSINQNYFQITTQELPATVADFNRTAGCSREELTSKELPLFVNQIARGEWNSSHASSKYDANFTTNSSDLPNFDALTASTQSFDTSREISEDQTEITSSELPQFVVQLGLESNKIESSTEISVNCVEPPNANQENACMYVANMQELPITVLECNESRKLETKLMEAKSELVPQFVLQL